MRFAQQKAQRGGVDTHQPYAPLSGLVTEGTAPSGWPPRFSMAAAPERQIVALSAFRSADYATHLIEFERPRRYLA
jgi:hypothetical protein